MFFVIAIIIIFLLFNNDSQEQFSLIGNDTVLFMQGVPYKEPGVIAKDKKGNNRISEVIISGNVDTSVCGDYQIQYIWREKSLVRKVVVYCQNEFRLVGNSTVYILKNGTYKEEGYVAYYQNQDYTKQVTIKNNVNYKVTGLYTIDYSIASLNKKISRRVYVIDVDDYFNVEYSNSKSKEVTLNIKYDANYISYYLNPTNDRVSFTDSTYKISKNGNYNFTVYDKYNNYAVKTISIKNIDDVKLTATCEAKITSSSTKVTVNANRKVSKYIYNNNTSTNSTYTFNSKVENVNVTLYDEYNDYINITCSRVYGSSKMEVHFINSTQCDDAILIRTDDKTILIDSGSHYTKDAVLSYLNAIGVKKIDAMIGSHMHSDHIQTQGFVLENYTVDRIYYPDDIFTCASRGSCVTTDQKYILDAIKKYNKTPIILKAGDKIEVGEMKIYVLAPWNIRTTSNSQNINSLVFILKFNNNTFMFTGDTDTSILTSSNLKSYASQLNIPLKVDVFKWPHHGTREFKSDFVNLISPKYVIVPNYNGYGKPTASMLVPFNNVGAIIYEQNTYGNVLFISDGNNIKVVTRTNPSDYRR